MKRITFVLALLLLCVPQFMGAQTIKVTGTVTSATEKYPLEGTGVMVKGTKNGVATDYNGQYVINVRKDAVLVFSSVGYKNVEIPVNGRSVINVAMEEDANLLAETIVVGYGSAKKLSTVVGAATTVKAKTLKDKPTINVADALQGQVAGLQIYSSSGDPGATVSMRLRGVNSINASNTPLFILDGSPVSSTVFQTLNQNDISSITVLKDASATAIYGSRAANGVVYITTKKGGGERPEAKVSFQYSASSLAYKPETMMNPKDWFAYRELVDPSLKTNTDFQTLKTFRLNNNIGGGWKKYFMNQTAPTYKTDVSFAGRTNKTDYYISANAVRQSAIFRNNNVTRYGIRSNINSEITDWLKVGLNLDLSYRVRKVALWSDGTRNTANGVIWGSFFSLPYSTPYEIKTDAKGNFLGYGGYQNYIKDNNWWGWRYLNGIQPRETNYVALNGNMYEEITPIKNLIFRFSQAMEGQDTRYWVQWLPEVNDVFGSNTGASESFSRFYRMTSTNTAEYKLAIGENHNFDALVGQEAIISNTRGFGASSTTTTDARMTTVATGVTYNQPTFNYSQDKMNSLFSRLDYNYAEKYFLNGSFRRDGSSLFGSANRYANFWSVGAMWDMKKEGFLKNVKWLDELKIKSSYGTTGNSGIDNYLSLGLISTGTSYNGNGSWSINNPSNQNLTWETVENMTLSLDFRLFNFVTAQIDAYRKTTKNMLISIPYSYSTGFGSGWGNVANMRNTGIEATLTFNIVQTRNTMFNVTANVSYNKNKITKLFGGRDEFVLSGTGLKLQTGHPYGEFFEVKYAGVDPANGKQLWYDKDGKVTSVYSTSNAVFTGHNEYAPWAGGVQFDFMWKNFGIQANFIGMFDKWIFDNDLYFIENAQQSSTTNQAKKMLTETWQYPGQRTTYPNVSETPQLDSRYEENASFVRLKNLQLSYTFGQDAVAPLRIVKSIRVYLVGRNLLTFTKFKGFDPEIDSNVASANYPNTKEYSVGVEFTF